MTTTSTPFLLCILDGVGCNPSKEGNAVALANTPTLDRLFKECPHTTLTTFGPAVGLPEGQMGNSEVGHLNIGAGRVVKQWLLRIGDAFKEGSVSNNPVFSRFAQEVRPNTIHLLGLCSYGGVHSHLDHLYSLLDQLSSSLPNAQFIIHLVGDGRDVPPNQFIEDLDKMEAEFSKYGERITIGSLSGRFYMMDRDKRWERTEEAFRAFQGYGSQSPISGDNASLSEVFHTLRKAVQDNYESGVTDEFFPPVIVQPHTHSEEDAIIFWNFRSDRMRQIVRALTDKTFSDFQREGITFSPERVICFAEYDQTFGLPVLFPTEAVKDHLGAVLADAGLTQLRVAETEKYPHVTYFLNGGEETEMKGEDRLLVPSPRDVKTYDQKPEMSALQVTEGVLEDIRGKKHDVIVLNFANGDMVGHTGVIEAASKAVETVDSCLGEILEALKEVGGQALIIADHGNAEQMIDPVTGGPHTSHTTFPVPAIYFSAEGASPLKLRDDGALCDVAPTVLDCLGVPQPKAMTGKSLILSDS